MNNDKKKQIKKTVLASVLLISVIIIIATVLIRHSDLLEKKVNPIELPFNKKPLLDYDSAKEPRGEYLSISINIKIPKKPFKVRGIYIAPSVLAKEGKINELIDYAHRNKINAFVIDLKNDYGQITYNSDIGKVKAIGADNKAYITDIEGLIRKLDENDIYPIARIVCFKDGFAGKNKELAVMNDNGEIWRDGGRNYWLNPYNPKAQDYLFNIIKEAAIKGFRDIQLDYVRFPSEGKLSNIDYGKDKDTSKSETISLFIKKARDVSGVCELSIDSFGMITTARGDLGIGQDLTELVKVCDVICPMVYPSHYTRGNFNLDYPDSKPYEVVYQALDGAVKRVEHIEYSGEKARFRPWLQSFSATWLKRSYGSNYLEYGSEEVLREIKACNDLGIDEWMLWNSASRYPELIGEDYEIFAE